MIKCDYIGSLVRDWKQLRRRTRRNVAAIRKTQRIARRDQEELVECLVDFSVNNEERLKKTPKSRVVQTVELRATD